MTQDRHGLAATQRRLIPPVSNPDKWRWRAAFMASVTLLAGCGSGAAAPVSATGGAPVPLVVYAAEGYDSAMTTAFQEATGIPTKLDDDSTGPLLAKIQAEINNPQWGLLWVDGDEGFAGLDQQGYLLKGWEPTTNWTAAATKETPADKSYIITGFTAMPAVVYDSTKVSSPPTSWTQLLEPQWKNAIGMNNPAISGPTYPFVAGMMSYLGCVSQGEQYFQQLKANGLQIFDTNKPTLAALTSGQIKLALVQNSAAIGEQFSDPNLKLAYLNPVTLLPSVIGIDSKVSKKEQAEAQQFVNFVFTQAGQLVRLSGDAQGDSLFWPAVQGQPQSPAVPPFSSIPYQVLNAYKWGGTQQTTVTSWFSNNIVS